MVSRHGNHLLVLNAKGNGRIYFAQLDFGHPPILVHTEGIVEVLADAFERLPCSEYVDPMDRGIIDEIEGPHVVQSSDMVFVFVRQQNRVDMPDPGPEHLVTEIGPSVDHQPYVVPLEHGRSPQTVIAGIFRGADGTPAADHRHSLRSSRAKNRKFHTHRKKRRSFCFSRRREQKYKKNTAEKRNRRFFSHAPDNGKQRVLPYARIGWSDCRYHSKRAAKTIHDTPGNSGGAHPNNSVSVGKILKPYRHNPIPLFLQIR